MFIRDQTTFSNIDKLNIEHNWEDLDIHLGNQQTFTFGDRN